MRVITVAGPPSVGKTLVILKTAGAIDGADCKVGVVKFDSLSTTDNTAYARAGASQWRRVSRAMSVSTIASAGAARPGSTC
jgi:Ni2+-binding GTPase involved in maturation of urease and hydrogenase